MKNCIFEPRTDISSATICKYCGQEKYLHINCTAPLISDVSKMVEDDVEIKNMFDLPTAEEFLDNYRAKSFYDKSVNSYYIGAMLEFSKIHVQDAVRRTKETLYTEEQVREAINKANKIKSQGFINGCLIEEKYTPDEIIQSLKK